MAQTLKFGNKVWAAKEDSVLAYNDINNNYKPLPFSFSRASIGTRVNKDGLIETMGQDIARIDYADSADGVLLLEDSRTNSLVQSNQFDTTWSATNSVLSSGQIGVGGSTNAWKLESNSNTSESYLRQTTSLSGTSSLTIYAKKGNVNFLGVYIGSSGADISAYFDLNNGIVGTTGNATETKIKSVGNGWYRCTIVGSDINQNVNFYVTDANGNFLSNDGSYIYIQYSQLELGSYPTSYIPTSGSTVTRAAETCNNSGNSEVFNDSEGVLFADISALADTAYIAVGTNSLNRILLGSSNTYVRSYNNIGGILIDFTSSILASKNNKLAIKYKSGDTDFYINGFKVFESNTAFTASVAFDTLEFQNLVGSTQNFYGKTKELGYYNTILTDAELETLTSYRNWVSMVNELNLNIIYNG